MSPTLIFYAISLAIFISSIGQKVIVTLCVYLHCILFVSGYTIAQKRGAVMHPVKQYYIVTMNDS